ncbi:Alpha/Beta hydrolase protein [Aspergillus heterothallicus]
MRVCTSGLLVTILNGTYEGYHPPTQRQDVFLGLPYARPPVGSLRFKEPHGLNAPLSGIRLATQYSNVCMQEITSSSLDPRRRPLQRLIAPDKSHQLRHSKAASENPFIAVSINYRLSAFGFLWGSDEVAAHGSANNGLRDQRLALAWIHENIGFFRGDPNKVTIFGQSGGSLSVGKQLIAYGGRDDSFFRVP